MAGFLQLALGFFDEPAAAPTPAPAPRAQPPSPPVVLDHPQGSRDIVLKGQRVRYAFRRGKRRTIGFVVGPEGLSVSTKIRTIKAKMSTY